jgi:hypothetical protein
MLHLSIWHLLLYTLAVFILTFKLIVFATKRQFIHYMNTWPIWRVETRDGFTYTSTRDRIKELRDSMNEGEIAIDFLAAKKYWENKK